ncbi:hypothetical protein DOO78_10215 [Roseicella frigidaeris]|uniref:Uncharacterized protein n=2 Tax=Roseicella frigidaeris TaxID=2230885 RepID=A0A327M958_9PROT|nr:hypothetical protein DOO78_10215 [Roseicella frigidaeris]
MLATVGLLAACAVPPEVNPVAIYNRVSGADDAARLPPPGMDGPTPNLASIPPRPERPSPEFRQAVTDSLARDRTQSRDPLVLRGTPAPPAAGPSPGSPPVPAAPPPRASLAAAPPVPWAEGPATPRAPAGALRPSAPAAPRLPEVPDEAPAAPPPDLLGPPPRPR